MVTPDHDLSIKKTGVAEDSSATPVLKNRAGVSRRNPDMPCGMVATGVTTFQDSARRDADMSDIKGEEPSHHFQ